MIALAACGRWNFDALGDPDVDLDSGADGNAHPFCDTVNPVPLKCDDFERTDPLDSGWSGNRLVYTGAVAFGDVAAMSGRSLAVDIGAMSVPGQQSTAVLVLDAGARTRVSIAYDVMFPVRPVSGDKELCNIAWTVPGSGNYYIDLDLRAAGGDVLLEEFDPGTTFMQMLTPLGTDLDAGSWHHVVISLDTAADRVTLDVDGVRLHDAASTYTPAAGTLRAEIGVVWATSGTHPAWSVFIDNVVIDAS